MTVTEAATVVGVTHSSAYLAVRRGELAAEQTKYGLTINADAIRRWHKVLIDRGLAHCRSEAEVERLLCALEDGD